MLLQSWVMAIPVELLPNVYNVCIALLSDSDLIVRVCAVVLVRNCTPNFHPFPVVVHRD